MDSGSDNLQEVPVKVCISENYMKPPVMKFKYNCYFLILETSEDVTACDVIDTTNVLQKSIREKLFFLNILLPDNPSKIYQQF